MHICIQVYSNMDRLFGRTYFRIKATHDIDMGNAKYATCQIGTFYRMQYPNSKEKVFKLGVRKIYDILNHRISKRQIKKFLNCSGFKNDSISIPYESYEIFKALAMLVDMHPEVKNACKNQCENCVNRVKTTYCRNKMINDFYELLMSNYNFLPERAKEILYNPMMNNTHKCD